MTDQEREEFKDAVKRGLADGSIKAAKESVSTDDAFKSVRTEAARVRRHAIAPKPDPGVNPGCKHNVLSHSATVKLLDAGESISRKCVVCGKWVLKSQWWPVEIETNESATIPGS